MKKVISILVVAALLMSLMVSAFATDSDVPTLTVGSATAEVGDEVTLEVTMSATKYAAYGLQILYDAEALELVAVDEGDEALKFFTANITTGMVTDFSNKDTKVDGVIFTMTFKVLKAGEHTVELEIESFNMADQSVLEVNAVAGTISVAGGDVPEVENPIVIGDNEIELVRGGDNSVEYNFVATETGTLYVAITEYKYSASWTDGAYEEEFDMYDFEEGTVFTVNGEVLSGVYYGAVEVVAGEVYTFAWSRNEDCTYGFLATLNLSWTDENIPSIGLDIPLKRADLPMNTVEIPAGEMVTYLVSAFDFQGYLLTITGENFYVSYQMYDYSIWDMVTVTLEPVDGVIELDVGTNYIQEFQIGNSGTEAATFVLDCYAPLGGLGNPIIVESLDEVETTIMPEVEGYTYFKWTATEVGTVWVTPGNFYISFENLTKEEYGEYDDTWENYGVYVEPGDEVLIAIGGWVEEETFFELAYWFEAGYRPGSELNPIEIDLLEPVDMSLYYETVYYTWTPAQSMVVTLNYTLQYTWSDKVPTLVINGEEYTLGAELTVTAGEPLVICASAVSSVYGTLQATVIEIIEEPIEVENPIVIGDNEIELPMGATEPSVYNFVATETGTLYIVATEFWYEASWTEGYEDNSDYMEDWTNNTVFTVNGEELSNGFYGAIEVVAGEVYTFSWSLQEHCTWGFKATLNLSYSDEKMPVPGIDTMLMPSDLPTTTVEIPAGGEQLYKFSYDFAGYIITITGENVYVSFQTFNYETWDYETVRIDAVDGVVEYDMNVYAMSEIYIGNEGSEAATFALDYYAPVGGQNNPIIVENLEDIFVSGDTELYSSVYFQWTSDKLGTIIVDTSNININFNNMTKAESGEYDSDWVNYMVYVEPGDVLQVVVSLAQAADYSFAYDFVEGYRLGSELNPYPVDLMEGLNVDLYNETIYYTWTPAEDMTVTIDFTLKYTWNERYPVVTINGEVYTMGEELTVTAGEPINVVVSTTEGSVYGTLKATKVETEDPGVEPGDATLVLGDNDAKAEVEYTFTAEANGELTIDASTGTIQFYGTQNFSGVYYDYGYLVLIVNGEAVEGSAKGVTTIAVTAGQVVTIKVEVKNPSYDDVRPLIKLSFVEGEQGGEDEVIYEGDTSVETTDTYGWFDKFDFTAPVTGTYTFYVPAGLGVWEAEAFETDWFSSPYVDFNSNTEGATFTVELTEGEVFSYYIGATTTGEWTITYTVVASEGGNEECEHEFVDGVCIHCGEEDPNYQPPVEDDNILDLGSNDTKAEIEYTFTAEADGELTIDASTGTLQFYGPQTFSGSYYSYNYLILYVDGVAIDGANKGVATITVTAGQVVTIKVEVNNASYADVCPVIKLSLTEGEVPGPGCEHEYVDGVCIHCGEEDPNYQPPVGEGDGTSGNPFIVGELPYTAEQNTSDDLYYKWTATENGTLYITYTNGMCTLSGSSVGSWQYADGGKYIKVAAGDVITINYWNGNGFTLTFVADSGEAEPGTEGNPIAIDSLNITLTTADDEIYYAWTATESGEIVIRVAECTWNFGYSLTVNGESLYGAGAQMTVNVEAGDQIIIMIVVYASASSDGYLTLEQVVEAPHECEFVVTDSKDATCTEDGYVTYTCECGETYTEIVPATGHTFVGGSCHCGEIDPDYNPGTGSLNVMALALIAGMSVAAVVVTARKKSDEE